MRARTATQRMSAQAVPLPARNRCWFAATIVAVRREYDLTIDQREAAVLDEVLKGCDDG